MLAIYVVSLYFYLCYENQFQFPRRRIRLHNLNVSWDMTFGCVYPKDYIASWTLVVAPSKYLLAFFWLIMSWHVGFSFRCFTAPIANPFTFSFPNTSWNNFRCWAEYIVISIVLFFSSHNFFSSSSSSLTSFQNPLIKFLLQSEEAQYQQAEGRANS